MENGFVDVTSIEEQQLNGAGPNPEVPSLVREVLIDRLVGERGGQGGDGQDHEFLVKFKPMKQAWVSAEVLAKFPVLLQNYEKQKANKPVYKDDADGDEDGGSDLNTEMSNKTDHTYATSMDSSRRRSERQHQPTRRFVDENSANSAKAKRSNQRKASLRGASRHVDTEEDADSDSQHEYKVEQVLKRREKDGQVEYFVKWEGYGAKFNSWEPRNGLKHLDVVKKFEEEFKGQKGDGEEEEEEEENEPEYKVERVLKKRFNKKGDVEYYVKWEGYAAKWNTWEPRKGIEHLDVVQQYEEEWERQQRDDSADEDQEYRVERILKKRVKKDKSVEYYVKWDGFSDSWNSWEPRDALEHLDVFQQYEANELGGRVDEDGRDHDEDDEDAGTPGPTTSTRSSQRLAAGSSSATKRGKSEEWKKAGEKEAGTSKTNNVETPSSKSKKAASATPAKKKKRRY